MNPLLWFEYLLATAGGMVVIGVAWNIVQFVHLVIRGMLVKPS